MEIYWHDYLCNMMSITCLTHEYYIMSRYFVISHYYHIHNGTEYLNYPEYLQRMLSFKYKHSFDSKNILEILILTVGNVFLGKSYHINTISLCYYFINTFLELRFSPSIEFYHPLNLEETCTSI